MVIGDGEFSDRDAHQADPGLIWAWDQVIDWGDVEPASPKSADSALPESIWGDETAGMGAAELEFPADPQFQNIWRLVPEGDDHLVDQSLVSDPPPGKRTLVPAPVPDRRPSRLRRALRALQGAPRVATLALAVTGTAGVLLAFAAFAQDTPPDSASRQIDAAGLQSTSTMPTSTVPRAPSTSLTTLVTPPQPESTAGGEAPAATFASPLPAATRATTPVTTAGPRSPARSEATVAPVAAPEEPAPVAAPEEPAPAPTPPETEAPPPPASIVLLPTEPETTVTTRRPRPTVPETTVAPSTTVPAPNDVPGEEDLTVPE